MAKGARRRQRSRRASYKRNRRNNWTTRDVDPAPVRTLSIEDLPEDSKLRPPQSDDQDTATG